MTKNSGQQRRTTRKEYLLSRKQQQQYHQARLAIGGVVGLLVLILAIGAIYEYLVKPGQPVAVAGETDILLGDWQDRVRFERAQAIGSVDALYEAVGQDVGQLQQFAGAQLQQLLIPSVMGEQVLFAMIDEANLRQEAETLGVSVSDAEVDSAIEERFNFYGGDLPPEDEATATPAPTPSITPIPAADATEVPEAEPEADPEPLPEPTAVSQEAFDDSFKEQIDDWVASGGTEDSYRERTRLGLLQEKVRDAMVNEEELTTEELQASFFYISFTSEADANAGQAAIQAGDFITFWNEVRSAERVTTTQPFASEFQFTSIQGISNSLGADASVAAETLEVGETSDVLTGANERFVIVNIRAREERPLSEARIDAQRNEVLQEWLSDQRDSTQLFQTRWESNIPDRPILDPKYYTAPEQPPVVEQ